MRAVTPEVKAVEQPVELLDGQDNGFVAGIHTADLALYLDQQWDAACKECAQLNKTLRAG